MLFDSRGLSCVLHPTAPAEGGVKGCGGGMGVVEKEEEEGTGIHVAHESHLIPTGRICGP